MIDVEKYTQVGVLGGGQLGKMLIQAGIDLNLHFQVMDPDPLAPCHAVAHTFIQGEITEEAAVWELGQSCDVLTIEIEHVNTRALYRLERLGKRVYPSPKVIEAVQDKRKQKQFYHNRGFPTANFWLIDDREQIYQYTDKLPLVHKTATAGYDGKGVKILHTQDDIPDSFEGSGLIEEKIVIQKEIAVIVARNLRGQKEVFPAVEMVFHPEGNLVEYLLAPAELNEKLLKQAKDLALELADALDHIGLLAVEMFLTQDDQWLINEIAPRPHNSGHHTIKACMTSQYEQHLRAILNLPLGQSTQIVPAAMINILGRPDYEGPMRLDWLEDLLKIPGVYPFIYGKQVSKPFRKMGHITLIHPNKSHLHSLIPQVQAILDPHTKS